ncbi:uncharacterized protein ACIB01_005565 [Guaruba guarouba]
MQVENGTVETPVGDSELRIGKPNASFTGIPNGQTSKEKQAPEAGSLFLLHLILLSDASRSSAFPRQAGSNPSAPLWETAGSRPWLGMGKASWRGSQCHPAMWKIITLCINSASRQHSRALAVH